MQAQAAQMEALVQAQAQEGMLQAVQAQERALDAELQSLERKMEEMDEDDIERIRERRKAAMKRQALQKQVWQRAGHGTYGELTSDEDLFQAFKDSDRLVVHFGRPSTARCEVLEAAMRRICTKHLETRFTGCNAERCPYLSDKLDIIVLPTLLLVKKQKVVAKLVGFDSFGGDGFRDDDLKAVLAEHEMIRYEADRSEEVEQAIESNIRRGVNSVGLSMLGGRGAQKGGARRGAYADDDDEVDDDRYEDEV